MINFRYHIVSLTAVFLSLILGIVMGTTVVSKATVDGLRSNLDAVEARSDRVSLANKQLQSQLRDAGRQDKALTDQMVVPTVQGALTGVPILVLADSGFDRVTADKVLSALVGAGANVDGTLVLNSRLQLKGDNKARLAEVLGVSPTSDVKRTLLSRLATVLGTSAQLPGFGPTTTTTIVAPPVSDTPVPPSPVPPTSVGVPPTNGIPAETTTTVPPPVAQPDLITGLRQAGFLDFRSLDGSPADGEVLTAAKYRYVVLSEANPGIANGSFLDPLIGNLAKHGPIPLVAASAATGTVPSLTRNAFTGPLLANDVLKGRISTVDNLETYSGLLALVFSLREFEVGRHGQYGLGADATSVLPSPIS